MPLTVGFLLCSLLMFSRFGYVHGMDLNASDDESSSLASESSHESSSSSNEPHVTDAQYQEAEDEAPVEGGGEEAVGGDTEELGSVSGDSAATDETSFQYIIDREDCEDFEAIKAYIRGGGTIRLQGMSDHTIFLRFLTSMQLISGNFHRDMAIMRRVVLHHSLPDRYPMDGMTEEALATLERSMQMLALMDAFCEEMLRDIHVEVNVEIDPQPLDHLGAAPLVGANMFACGH